jgi:hypothetical protein
MIGAGRNPLIRAIQAETCDASPGYAIAKLSEMEARKRLIRRRLSEGKGR